MTFKNRSLLARCLAAVFLCCLAQSGFARQSDVPVEITSDTAEYNEKDATVSYTGNVVVVQGKATLNCARLTLHQPPGGPQVIVAEGNPVRFHQPQDDEGTKEINGSAKRAEYDLDNRILTLIGDAEVIQETDRVTSDRIVYDMASATVKAGAAASGSERVRTIIQPRQ